MMRSACATVVALLVLAPSVLSAQHQQIPDALTHLLEVVSGDWAFEAVGEDLIANLDAVPIERGAKLSVDVTGMQVFSFVPRADDGVIVAVLRDGSTVRSLSGAPGPQEIPLDGARTLEFHVTTVRAATQASLTLIGGETVLPPAVLGAPSWLAGCVLPPLTFSLVGIVPLRADGLVVTLDGAPLVTQAVASRDGEVHRLDVIAAVVAPTGQSVHRLVVHVEDATGNVWTVIDRALPIHRHGEFALRGAGWAYELQPTVGFSSLWCTTADVSSWGFVLDGIDRTADAVWSVGGPAFTFDHPLEFEESHSFAFWLKLADGSTISRRGSVREGLDVDEFDVGPGALVYISTGAEATLVSPGVEGEAPIAVAAIAAIPAGDAVIELNEGAHLRAIYAPRALRCADVLSWSACDAYGGDAPGFTPERAWLEITPTGGETLMIPAAGQLVAAARASYAGSL